MSFDYSLEGAIPPRKKKQPMMETLMMIKTLAIEQWQEHGLSANRRAWFISTGRLTRLKFFCGAYRIERVLLDDLIDVLRT